MNFRTLCSVVFGLAVACMVVLPLAQGSEANEQTKVTFDHSVEVPGCVLQAGSYWFVRDTNDTDVVRIFSLDWKTLYATEMTASAERATPFDNTSFTFAERETSSSEALVKWFYPGRTIGHEFLYSKQEERELAHDRQLTIVSGREAQPGL